MKGRTKAKEFSFWFYFLELKERFPIKDEFSKKALWQYLQRCGWFQELIKATLKHSVLVPIEKMSLKEFWAYVKRHEWAIKVLKTAEEQENAIFLEELEDLLPKAFFYAKQKNRWEVFGQALEFYIWQWSAESLANFQIIYDDGAYVPKTVAGFMPPERGFKYLARCENPVLRLEVKKSYGIIYLPLVKKIATHLAIKFPSHIDLADLIQSGFLGLWEALDSFEPKRRIKFETFAYKRIKGAILDELRALDFVPRSVRKDNRKLNNAIAMLQSKFGGVPAYKQIAEALGVTHDQVFAMMEAEKNCLIGSLDESHGGRESDDAELLKIDLVRDYVLATLLEMLEWDELCAFLRDCIVNKLSIQQTTVIKNRFWHDLTLKEISLAIGASESRVSQVLTKSIFILRCLMFQKFGVPFIESDGNGGFVFKQTPLPPKRPCTY